jgi:hypothetical protein
MNKIISVFSLVTVLTVLYSPVNAAQISKSGISGKSVLAGVLSLIIWPGIGQAVNDEPGKKVVTHAIVGLIPPFRFWSGYDALVDRHGGYWDGKV